MKLFAAASIFLLAAQAAQADVSKEDIKKLAQAGVGENTILAYVKAHGPMAPLSADDLAELKKAGVSEKLLQSLLNGAPEKVPAAPAQPLVNPGGGYPSGSTTYVYDSPAYYSSYDNPYYPYYSSYYYPGFGFNFGFYPRNRFFFSNNRFFNTSRPFVGFHGATGFRGGGFRGGGGFHR